MRSQSLIAAAATAAALIVTASPAQAASSKTPATRCVHEVYFGPTVVGWIMDDATTKRRELIYKTVDQAMNGGTRHLVILFTCYPKR